MLAHTARRLSSLALGALCLACTGHSVSRVTDKADAHSVHYALPKTVLSATVPVTRELFKLGTCSEQLEASGWTTGPLSRLCPATKKLRECLQVPPAPVAKQQLEMGELRLESRAEPDLSQVFAVTVKGSALKKQEVSLKLSEAGLLISGESTVTSVGPSLGLAIFKALADVVSLAASTEAAAAAAEACKAAAGQIITIRDDRRAWLEGIDDGSTKIDADRLQLLISEGRRVEESLLARFLTSSSKEVLPVRCEIRPEKGKDGKTSLLELNESVGLIKDLTKGSCFIPGPLLDKTDGSSAGKGFKVLSVEIADISDYARRFVDIELKGTTASSSNQDSNRDSKQDSRRGFYYRIPGSAELTFRLKGSSDASVDVEREVHVERAVVAQLGVVTALPQQKALTSKYAVELYEMSGALKSVGSTGSGIDPSYISEVAAVAKATLAAEETEESAERAAADELVQLERERKLLEERKKIRDLKKELGEAAAP